MISQPTTTTTGHRTNMSTTTTARHDVWYFTADITCNGAEVVRSVAIRPIKPEVTS